MKSIGILLVALAALILCAAPGAHAQGGKVTGTYFFLTDSAGVKISLDSVGGHTADTLRLARTKHSVIKIIPRSGTSGAAPDTLTSISGGVKGQIYYFFTASKDTSVVFYKDNTNVLKLSGNVKLTDTSDVLAIWYDGRRYIELFSSLNH